MTERPDNLAPFLEPLAAVQRLIDRFAGRGTLIGGIAVSLLSRPRLTADLDVLLLLSIEDLPRLIEHATAEGFEPRISDACGFARQNRVVLLRHVASGVNVDISLGALPFEHEVVARSALCQLGGLEVRVPTPEDLIILKAVAHRPKDLLDIREIIETHPDLDRDRIRRWLTQFAAALEMPELWDDIADWL